MLKMSSFGTNARRETLRHSYIALSYKPVYLPKALSQATPDLRQMLLQVIDFLCFSRNPTVKFFLQETHQQMR